MITVDILSEVKRNAAFSVGDYKLDLPHFYSVSSEVKDLISHLIVLNPDSRCSADQGKSSYLGYDLGHKTTLLFSIETLLAETK